MWRDTALPLRLLGCDYRLLLPLSLWALHMAWWTFYVSVGAIIIFGVVERLGLTVPAAVRMARSFLAGRVRPAVPPQRRRRLA